MSGLMNSIQSMLGKLWTSIANGFDKALPPDKRDELLSKLQDFANRNPKFVAFLATHVVFTGIPILLFIFFTLSIFIFSLVTALLTAIVAAVFFTFFMIGVTLVFLVPTVCLTTFTASFVFLWGLGGWFALKWFTQDDVSVNGKSIGDKVDEFTNGRAILAADGASGKQELIHSGHDQEVKQHADDHESDGRASGPELEKVTESLRDETKQPPNPSPVKILKIVEGDESAVDSEKPAVNAAKETVGGAVET